MSDRFPSISPDGARIAASALPRGGQAVQFVGAALGEWRPEPIEFDASGGVWQSPTRLLFVRNKDRDPQNGAILRWDSAVGLVTEFHPPGLEGFSCHNGHFAGWWRDDRLKSRTISEDGHIAGTVDIGDGRRVSLQVDGVEIDLGPIGEPRYTGEALVWIRYVDGVRRVFGRRHHGAPTEHLSAFPDDEFWPLAIETPIGLYVMTHGHPERGRPLFLRPWAEGQTHGHVVAQGITDRPDARAIGSGEVLVAYSDLRELRRVSINLDAPLVDIRGPIVVPPVDPPPRPPDPPKEPDVSVRDVPNRVDAVEAARDRYPIEWFNCHRDYERQGQPGATTREEAEAFIQRLAYDLHRQDPRFGLNGKRGTSTLSQDALCFRHDDGRESVIDVVVGAGGSNPSPTWAVVGHYRVAGDGQRWIKPEAVGTQQPPANPGTPRPPTQQPPAFTFPTGVEMPQDVSLSIIDRYLAGIRERDKIRGDSDTVPSRGALMYLQTVTFRELATWIVQQKRAPQGAEWWPVSDIVAAAAVKYYQDRQGVD